MAESHETGKKGEQTAIKYLEEKGYQVLHCNWQSNHQEVDIVAKKDGYLIIAEVKTRKSAAYGDPEIFVTRQKQKMLIKAANHYLALHKSDLEVRFDIITILINGEDHHLKHIKNAFYPTLL